MPALRGAALEERREAEGALFLQGDLRDSSGDRSAAVEDRAITMRFLWISPQPFYAVRGTPMNIRKLAGTLARLGHEIHIVSFGLGEDVPLPPGVRLSRARRLPGNRRVPIGPSFVKIPLDVLLLVRAAGILRAEPGRYHVLQGFEEGGWIAAVLGRAFGIPFVYDMDSDLEESARGSGRWLFRRLAPLVGRIDRQVLRRASAVLTVCEQLSDRVRALAPGVPVFQIEDTATVPISRDRERASAALRERWELPEGPLVVYTGNLERYQGVDLLVRAAASVGARRPDAVFLIAGGEDAQVDRLKRLARESAANGRVIFTGSRPESEMGDFLAAADVLVSPRSMGANTPLKLYSYLGSGAPVVVTDRPVHTQVVSAGEAVLAEPSPEGIAAGVLTILENPEHGRRLAAAARRLVESRYGESAFAEKARVFTEGIESLLSGSPPRVEAAR